ncbi:MAG: hypothetical protein KF823_15260 [Xanthomonadales bacterium]|nr:hypothetical protein [Xanthomonadales bacterium]
MGGIRAAHPGRLYFFPGLGSGLYWALGPVRQAIPGLTFNISRFVGGIQARPGRLFSLQRTERPDARKQDRPDRPSLA